MNTWYSSQTASIDKYQVTDVQVSSWAIVVDVQLRKDVTEAFMDNFINTYGPNFTRIQDGRVITT